jgi:hypothetical protein
MAVSAKTVSVWDGGAAGVDRQVLLLLQPIHMYDPMLTRHAWNCGSELRWNDPLKRSAASGPGGCCSAACSLAAASSAGTTL